MIIFATEALSISAAINKESQEDQLEAMPALTMQLKGQSAMNVITPSSAMPLPADASGVEQTPSVVRLGVGPRWWS